MLASHAQPALDRPSSTGTRLRTGRAAACVRRARLSMSKSAIAMAAPMPPVMVNGCTGKTGFATAEAVVRRGLQLIPTAFSATKAGQTVECLGVSVKLQAFSDEAIQDLMKQYPGLIVVDYTHPDAVHVNSTLADVKAAGTYAVIAPQMGKQLVAFQGAMEIMAKEFPNAFKGYTMTVKEAHQSSKVDTSGTAKAVVSSFQKLGLDFEIGQIDKVRDRAGQLGMGVPEEHLPGHAYHTYHLTSPDGMVNLEFQHNVCGRSIYAEGTVDAVQFIAERAANKAQKTLYDMVDVLRESSA